MSSREATVIVVSHNHSTYLPFLLRSIEQQSVPPAAVVLCDDNSTDDSAAVMRQWASTTEVPVHLLLRDANIGLTRTLNEALALVATPFYAYISGDDVMYPDRLAAQLALIEETGSAFVYSDAHVIDASGATIDRSHVTTHAGGPPEDSFDALIRSGNWIPAASVMLRTSAVRSVGGYDEDLFFEDFDLWLRLASRYSFAHLDAPLVCFRVLETSLGSTKFTDEDDDYRWARVRISAKHFGRDKATDLFIARLIRPWLITLAAKGHSRGQIAPLMRRCAMADPTAKTLVWAILASVPADPVLHGMARGR